MSGREKDLFGDLLEPVSRASVVQEVRATLGVNLVQAKQIVEAFDTFVARPLEKNLRRFRGKDLAKRNPMIYMVRGVVLVDDWVDRVLEDRETSAIESHLGTFLEETARVVIGHTGPQARGQAVESC